MSCAIGGANWTRARILFDDASAAEVDDNIDLDAPDASGLFNGRFRHRATGTVLGDRLIDGRCISDGSISRIVLTRKHDGVNTTTKYRGRVIAVANSTSLLIRGRFSRATVNADGTVNIADGDWETEKPT